MSEDPTLLFAAWKRLSRTESEDQLLAMLPVEVCHCGFGRSAVTMLTENIGRVVGAEVAGDPRASASLMATLTVTRVTLAALPRETEMLQRMEPIVLADVEAEAPMFSRVARAVGSESYAAAPVSVENYPALMLHADRPSHGGRVTTADADRLGVLALLVGRMLEQTAFRRRIAMLRAEVRRANASVRVVLDDQLHAPVRLAPAMDLAGDQIDGHSMASWFLSSTSSAAPTLTKREREVMNCVAAGMSNAQIAASLIISEQTVRSHLKRILRKLRASNRAEAVARWIALSSQSMPSGPSSAPARN